MFTAKVLSVIVPVNPVVFRLVRIPETGTVWSIVIEVELPLKTTLSPFTGTPLGLRRCRRGPRPPPKERPADHLADRREHVLLEVRADLAEARPPDRRRLRQ